MEMGKPEKVWHCPEIISKLLETVSFLAGVSISLNSMSKTDQELLAI